MNSGTSSKQIVDEMLSLLKPPTPVVDHDANSKVASFYANRSVFITGATGFIGKSLIEKLVRSCEKVRRIYILVREKQGKCVQERLAALIKSKCFDRIREAHDGSNRVLEEKLYAIQGDITMPKFGVSPEDLRMISKECTIVFNSAATIKFVEPLNVAVRNNIYSVGQLVEFCNELENLEALIHLSTAYSNCHKRDTIYEIFYEPPMRGDQIQKSVEKLAEIQNQIHVYREVSSDQDDNNESSLRPSRSACKLQDFYLDGLKFACSKSESCANGLLASSASSASLMLNGDSSSSSSSNNNNNNNEDTSSNYKNDQQTDRVPATYDLLEEFTRIALRRSNRPNTYTFTKAISEYYLLDKVQSRPDRYLNDKIPVALVRPSIVGGAWREPIVGLVDNFNGPTSAILSLYTGALQAMPGGGECVADLVPVDMVTNMILCTAWYLVCQSKTGSSSLISSNIKRDQGAYVFNFVSGFRNPLHWHIVTDLIAELAYKYPSKILMRLPSSYFIKAGKFYDFYDLVNHKFPAYLMDLVKSKLMGQRCEGRSSALASYSRIRAMTKTLTPFTSNQWRLSDANTQALYECLDVTDKSLFHFDVSSINWYDYIRSYIVGSRIYTLRDEAKNVPGALKQLKQRQILNVIGILLLLLLIYLFFLRGSLLESTLLGGGDL